jgi:hypothetical protein
MLQLVMELNDYFIERYEMYLDIKEKLEECFRQIKKESDNLKEKLYE